jgi:D-3-phosphoglycerate dehydrogenase
MKILIADSFPSSHADSLAQMGHSCTIEPGLDENTLPVAIADHEIIIVRSTKVTAEALDAGEDLKLVIRAGAGTNTIDKSHASSKGVRVCNVPGANAVAVAELVMGMIIAIDRNIAANVTDLRSKVWNKKKYSNARGLHGQCIGILGLGAIGMAVAERAAAFGMKVYGVAKPGRSEAAHKRIESAGITELANIEAVLSNCDIISIHLPAIESTIGIVDKNFLNQMKDGAILINTSRGELVNEHDLIEAMNQKGIRAGLDVYQDEPGAGDNTFESAVACHENVCGTHHIGASTEQAQTAVADGVLEVVQEFESGKVLNCVNA